MNFNFKSNEKNFTNFDDLPGNERYSLQVEASELTSSKTTGTPQIKVQVILTEGKHQNRKAWLYFGLGEKQQSILYSFLKGIGSDLINQDNVTPEHIVKDLEGRCFSAFLEYKLKDGNRIANWKNYKAEDEFPAKGKSSMKSSGLLD